MKTITLLSALLFLESSLAMGQQYGPVHLQGRRDYISSSGFHHPQRGGQRGLQSSFNLDYASADFNYAQLIGTYPYFLFWPINNAFKAGPPADTLGNNTCKWTAVRYDSLYNFSSGIGYPYQGTDITIDWIGLQCNHKKHSAQNDTLIVSVLERANTPSGFTSVNNGVTVTNAVLWDTMIITNTSLTPGVPGNQADTYSILCYAQVPTGTRFIIKVDYKGPVIDTFKLADYNRDDCLTPAGPAPGDFVNASESIFPFNSWRYLNLFFPPSNNLSGIGGLILNGVDTTCNQYYFQNWGISAYVTINTSSSTPLSVSISGNTSVCPGNGTNLTANPSGGNPPYDYFWSNGSTTQNISVSAIGTYSVTVTDFNGNIATASVNITTNSNCQNGCTAVPSLATGSCTPPPLPAAGFSDTSICVVQGQAVYEEIYFQNFDTISGVVVEWIRIDSLTNLPCGLSFETNHGNNTFLTAENGCITFTGTTNTPSGPYQLGIWITLKVSILPNPISGEAGFISSQFGGPPFAFNVVVNNPGVPCTSGGQVTVSGNILTETGNGINTVTVNATGASAPTDITNSAGSYSLVFNAGGSVSVTPSKNNDASTNNGNSTLDILLIRRHILNVALLGTPYKVIAADVNLSGSVSTADILLIRSLVLQMTSTFPNNKLWSFVPHNYVFSNPQNPFPFAGNRTYNNLSTNMSGEDYIGMKLGDVNGDYDPNTAKTDAVGKVEFIIGNHEASTGGEIIVPVKVKGFHNVTGYQFTISWDSETLELTDVANRSLNGYYGKQKASEGFLTTSWDDEIAKGVSLKDGETVFELKFKVIGKNGSFSEIKIGSEMTAGEAYNEHLDLLDVRSTNGIVKVGNANRFHPSEGWNLSVSPNPFTNSTQIIFDLPQDESVTISIYDILGKEVKRIGGTYHAGRNQVQWTADDASGNALSGGLYHMKITAGSTVKAVKASLAR